MGLAMYASACSLLDTMEEHEKRLVQAMEDLEHWAAGVRVHHEGIQRGIDLEHMALSHKRQEILSL
jgi:hypothetical protein